VIEHFARAAAERGLAVIRLWAPETTAATDHDAACCCFLGHDCPNPGKHPVDVGWTSNWTTDPDRAFATFADEADIYNLGIVCGKPSGNLVVIDVDVRHGGEECLASCLAEVSASLPATLTVGRQRLDGTFTGDVHYYLRLPPDEPPVGAKLCDGVDLQGTSGKQAVGPGSRHYSGATYVVTDRSPIITLQAGDPLLDLLRDARGVYGDTGSVDKSVNLSALERGQARIPSGARDHTVFRLVSKYRGMNLSEIEARQRLVAILSRPNVMDQPPGDEFTPAHVDRIIRNVYGRYEAGREEQTLSPEQKMWIAQQQQTAPIVLHEHLAGVVHQPPAVEPVVVVEKEGEQQLLDERGLPLEFKLTTVGCARLFVLQHGEYVRFLPGFEHDNGWHYFDRRSGLWVHDDTRVHMSTLMQATINSVPAYFQDDLDTLEQVMQWHARAEDTYEVALRHASRQASLQANHDDFDAIPELYPLEASDCVHFTEEWQYQQVRAVGLEAVPVRKLIAEDLVMKRFNLRFSEVPDPLRYWNRLVQAWWPDDEIQEWAQRCFGYALTGSGAERSFLICHGDKESGKSSALEALGEAFGDFGVEINPQLIVERRGQHIDDRNLQARALPGARLAVIGETRPGDRYRDDIIKTLTSGGLDALSVRPMYSNGYMFHNRAFLVLMTNHLPEVAEVGDALWSRMRLLPFTNRFAPGAAGTLNPLELKRQIHTDREAVFEWLLEGAQSYYKRGLVMPSSVAEMLSGEREREDWFSAFRRECLQDTAGAKLTRKNVYLAYEQWAERAGEGEPVTSKKFSQHMRTHYRGKRGTGGFQVYEGVQLKPELTAGKPAQPGDWTP
jgi:P4 family phage/plasmid primase-like protien